MNWIKAASKVIVAAGGIVGAHWLLPEDVGLIVEAIIAAAAVFARSPRDGK